MKELSSVTAEIPAASVWAAQRRETEGVNKTKIEIKGCLCKLTLDFGVGLSDSLLSICDIEGAALTSPWGCSASSASTRAVPKTFPKISRSSLGLTCCSPGGSPPLGPCQPIPNYLFFVQKQFKNVCDRVWHWINLPMKKVKCRKIQSFIV